VLTQLNRVLHQNIKDRLRHDGFMTLQLLRHEGDGRFVFAGLHCDMLIHRAATRTVERLESAGVWIGLMPEIAELTHDGTFQLAPDDVLLLYTDGLIEAQNAEKEQFDVDRLAEALARHADRPAEAIQAQILQEVQSWLHEQLDDMSLIVLKRSPVAPPPSADAHPTLDVASRPPAHADLAAHGK
jgi:serine phosphatase RsbU (regulator of sigma subunit)